MHCQFYDEEEFEPRITPKPMAKLDCFAVPSVPEVSLVFDKPITRNLNDGDINSSSAKSTRSVQASDTNTISSSSDKHNSYAAWKEQNYFKEINSINTKYIPPLRKNTYNCNHAQQSDLRDTSVQQQREQNRVTTTRPNDGIYEKSVRFKCPNVDDTSNLVSEIQLSPSSEKHLSFSSLQKATCNVTDHITRMPSNVIVDAPKKNEHLQIPYTGCQYPFQQIYPPTYSNRDIDNNETVKTLLQLVNSQSDQIKTLQLQIDRLVRMQEESFRSKSTCLCSSHHANQKFEYPSMNCYDTTNTASSSHAQSHNQGINKTADQGVSVIEKKDVENLGENKDSKKMEVALLEQQSKKAFVEQKVSIGVMTSFEFTVQNSPFLMDSEIYEKKEIQGENSNINRKSASNIHDTTESVKRYKNAFTCKPGAQLENIVEDTESYLSSSQQQSSNFNANSFVRDSERHTSKQSDLHNMTNTSESSRTYQRLATDLNQEQMHEGMYIKKGSNMNEQVQNMRKMSNPSTNVSYSPTGSANCNKVLVASNVKDYTTIDREKNDTNSNRHPLYNAHLPATNYYQGHGNKEYTANVKQIKDVGDSMILSGGDLKVLERPPPTPEPSIHVEMQEYTSDDESDKLKRTSKIGWTFYNNVLGQVNEILQHSSVMKDKDQNDAKITRRVEQEDDMETRTALNTVKATTLEQLRKLGISLTENNEHRESNGNKTLEFDSSFYPRLDRQANMMQATSVVNETNTSMHMKALALKYLSDEQLADIALHKQGSSSLKHLMLSNMQGTNMSFATMRYLERYQLLPGRNNVQSEDPGQIYDETMPKHDFKSATEKNNPALRRFPFVQTPGTTCPSRILDISTLKRQPKLL